jgi:hypothetical protein
MISHTLTGMRASLKESQLHYTIQGLIKGMLFTMAVCTPVCIVAVVVKLWT